MFECRRARLATVVTLIGIHAGCAAAGDGLDDVARFDAIEDLRIGSIDDPATSFQWVGRLTVAPDGTIYSEHQNEAFVRVFGADGAPRGRIGRDGEGPGEFRGPSGSYVHGDTLWVFDASLARFSAFDRASGAFLDDRAARPVPVEGGTAAPAALLHDGSLAARQSVRRAGGTNDPGAVPESRWYRIASDGTATLLGVLEPADTRWFITMDDNSNAIASQPFATGDLLDVSPHEPAVVRVRRIPEDGAPPAFHVIRMDFAGDTVWTRMMPYEPMPVPRTLADSLVENMAQLLSRGDSAAHARIGVAARRTLRVPETVPPVSDLVLGSDGTVWLKREALGTPAADWLLLDGETGETVGVVALPSGFRLLACDRTHAWGAIGDALDVSYIVRYELTPMAADR